MLELKKLFNIRNQNTDVQNLYTKNYKILIKKNQSK